MTKFTAQENATRKEVFNYNRNRASWMDSCTKKFGKSKVVRQAIEDSNKRIASHTPVLTGIDAYKARLVERLMGLAACLPDSGYRMGDFKHIYCRHLGIVSSYDATEEYAKSCKFRATHGRVEVGLPIRLLAKAENMHGMITVRTKQVQNRIWKAQWVVFDYTRNGRGIINSDITFHMVSGYVALGSSEGWNELVDYWYHTETLADARQYLARNAKFEKQFAVEQKQKAKARAIRAKEDEKRAKAEARANAKADKEFAKQVKRVEKSTEFADILQHMYVYQDSIKAGNCVPGTNNFLNAHNLQKTDTRSGEFLLRISRRTWQHENVVRILVRYAADTHPAFYEQNQKAIRSILNTL
jgi:hypothetical protein